MRSRESGFGFLELIVALAVIVGIGYAVMKHSKSPAMSESTRKSLESQGIAIPKGADVSRSKALEGMVQGQLDQANSEHAKKLECSIADNVGCEASPSPSPAPPTSP